MVMQQDKLIQLEFNNILRVAAIKAKKKWIFNVYLKIEKLLGHDLFLSKTAGDEWFKAGLGTIASMSYLITFCGGNYLKDMVQ